MSKKIIRIIAVLSVPALLLATLTSCLGKDQIKAIDLIDALCQAEKPLPAGQIYSRTEDSRADGLLSDELLAVTYGKGSLPPAFDAVRDAACFLSYTSPCEFAVFLCRSRDAAQELSKVCLRRLDSLRIRYAEDSFFSTETAAPYLENAQVWVRGNWVILCISSDPDSSFRSCKKLI